MKITRRQLKNLIREALLLEEDYDCVRDYMNMGYSRSAAMRECGVSSERSRGYGGYRSRRRKPMSYVGLNDSTISDIENTLSAHGESLSSWEKSFLEKIHYQLKFKRVGLSPKQKAKVDELIITDDDPDTNNDGMLSTAELVDMTHDIVDDIKAESATELTRDMLGRILREEISTIIEKSGGLLREKASEHT